MPLAWQPFQHANSIQFPAPACLKLETSHLKLPHLQPSYRTGRGDLARAGAGGARRRQPGGACCPLSEVSAALGPPMAAHGNKK
jgi:hypothetical protein